MKVTKLAVLNMGFYLLGDRPHWKVGHAACKEPDLVHLHKIAGGKVKIKGY